MRKEEYAVQNSILLILGLIAIEVIQYFIIIDKGFLGGDFSMSMPVDSSLINSLIISISIWLFTYIIFKISKSNENRRLSLPVTTTILLLFVFNFVITVLGDVGNVMSSTKSQLSILTTLIPINYLILISAQEKNNKKFIIASLILILIDLYRLLLGAVLKVGYIILMKATRKQILIMLIMLPLMIMPIKELITYKFETRGMPLEDVGEVVVDIVTSRIATLSTVHFMASNAKELSEYCHRSDYSSPWLAAGLSVIPKSIFGLEFVKTFNNCLIEFYLDRSVPDSSVNSPWFMTLYIEALSGVGNFLSYLFLTMSMITLIVKISNFLFGSSGDIFKLWVIFEFMWTGNILHLTIPLYFLIIISIYYLIVKNIKNQKINL